MCDKHDVRICEAVEKHTKESGNILLKTVLLGVVVVAVQYVAWKVIIHNYPKFSDAEEFSGTFGAIDTLFSGLAFAGVIWAILLQRIGLNLQHDEIMSIRDERTFEEKRRMREATLATSTVSFEWPNGERGDKLQVSLRNTTQTIFRPSVASASEEVSIHLDSKMVVVNDDQFEVIVTRKDDNILLSELPVISFELYYIDLDGRSRSQTYSLDMARGLAKCTNLRLSTLATEILYSDD